MLIKARGAVALVIVFGGLTAAAALRAETSASAPAAAADLEERIKKARDAVTTVAERFRAELGSMIKASGPAGALGACQSASTDLPTAVGDETGFEISRTALKLRNPENAPDPWELDVLKNFQAKAAAGSEAAKLEFADVVVTPEGDKLFRYMKAIPVTEACLACHGTDLKQDVKAEISKYYPEDKAVGFKLGDMRGAFTVTQTISEAAPK